MTDKQTELFMANKELVPWVLINKLKVSPSDSFFDDLMQEGYIALMQSCECFDPGKGVKFSTYATPQIYGKTMRYLHDYCCPISRHDYVIITKYNQAIENGMNVDEFCEKYHVKRYRIDQIISQMNPISIDATVEASSVSSENTRCLADLIADRMTLNGLHMDEETDSISMADIKDAIMAVAEKDGIRVQRDLWIEHCYALIYAAENGECVIAEKKHEYLSKKYGISRQYASSIISKGMKLLQKELKKKLNE